MDATLRALLTDISTHGDDDHECGHYQEYQCLSHIQRQAREALAAHPAAADDAKVRERAADEHAKAYMRTATGCGLGLTDYERVMEASRRGYLAGAAHSADADDAEGWRPIETAPKTRTAILVHCEGNHCTYTVYWREYDDRPWWYIFGASNYRLEREPMYWQPLPAPPNGVR